MKGETQEWSNRRTCPTGAVSIATLSAAKGFPAVAEILRCAQNDRFGGDFEKPNTEAKR